MPKRQQTAQQIKNRGEALSAKEKQKRKERVLTQGTASFTSSIADAIVIKNQNVFFLTTPDGNVPLKKNHGYGLYYHDCRYLSGYTLRLADAKPNVLISDAAQGFRAIFDMTNNEIQVDEGRHIPKDDIGITWERVLDGAQCALYDVLRFQNYALEPIQFHLSLAFQAEFEDIFAIRGLLPGHPGKLEPPAWQDDVLTFAYHGGDGLDRRLTIHCSQAPDRVDDTLAYFQVRLPPQKSHRLMITLIIHEAPSSVQTVSSGKQARKLEQVKSVQQQAADAWVGEKTSVQSDSLLLNATIARSLRDLHMLRTSIGEQRFFAAGVPWFVTLFGRDSIITAMQTLAFNPEIAAETLRVLARYQGERVDAWRDEQPGKILHELRVGELARLGEIPHLPYYGTIDATPLFLSLFVRHAGWTGDLTLFNELRSNVERGLEWIDRYGDSNGDGYVEYQSASEKGGDV
ncbi:MAG: hypothetical protein HY782_09745 [Chloroflexi bacterium]|nr:hypothetical protein [Chloroflexota bacterium]